MRTSTRCFLLAGAIVIGATAARSQTFPGVLLPGPRYPSDGALADVTGDGFDDLITISNPPIAGQNGTLRLFPGTGAGAFATSTAFAVGEEPLAVATGDLNADGVPDAVVVNAWPNSDLYVFVGNGSGSFTSLGTFSTLGAAPGSGTTPVAVVLVDVDGDSILDAVTTNVGSQDLSILIGNGSGGFAAPSIVAVGSVTGAAPTVIATGDLDGDGDADLALGLANPNHQVSTWLGNGAGSFAFGAYITTAIDAVSLAIADFDLDANADVVAALPNVPAAHVYRGTGTGTGFSSPVVFAEPGVPQRVAVTDLDGDGKPDLLSLNQDTSFSIFRGTGTAVISNGLFSRYATDTYAVALAIGDLNGDGKPDLTAVCNSLYGVGSFTTYQNAGALAFPNARSYRVGVSPTSVAIADFNNDGKPDLVTSDSFSGGLSLLLQRSQGIFGSTTSIALPVSSGCVAAADVDLDGNQDLVVASTGIFSAPGSTILVLRGVGNGTFLAPVSFSVGGFMPRNVTLADLNADGRIDAITANLVTNDVSVLLGTSPTWGFAAPAVYQVTSSAFSPYSVAAGDLNSDGVADLVVAHNDSTITHQTVLFGTGGGAFNAAAALAVPVGGSLPIWAAIGDLTGDGFMDIASANFSSPGANAGLAAGNGAGGFAAPVTFVVEPQSFMIAIADFNTDGIQDFVTADTFWTNHLAVKLGLGGGAFGRAEIYGSGDRTQTLGVADLNLDGKPDMVGVNYDSNNIAVHIN